MALATRCPGCAATLPIPTGFTGRSIRCGRCRLVVPVPSPAAKAAPVLNAEPVPEPPPPIASRAPVRSVLAPTDDEPEAERPVPRRHRQERPARVAASGFSPPQRAAVLVGGIGLAGLLMVGCCGGVFYFASSDRGGERQPVERGDPRETVAAPPVGEVVTRREPPAPPPGPLPDRPIPAEPGPPDSLGADGWERKLVPGTHLTVEIPRHKFGAPRKGQNPYPARAEFGLYVEREGPNGLVKFMAGPSMANVPVPPPALEDKIQKSRERGPNELGPNGRIKKTFTRPGLLMAVATGKDWTGFGDEDSIILFVQVESGFVTSFTVVGNGLDEDHPDVKRFFGSVRVGR